MATIAQGDPHEPQSSREAGGISDDERVALVPRGQMRLQQAHVDAAGPVDAVQEPDHPAQTGRGVRGTGERQGDARQRRGVREHRAGNSPRQRLLEPLVHYRPRPLQLGGDDIVDHPRRATSGGVGCISQHGSYHFPCV